MNDALLELLVTVGVPHVTPPPEPELPDAWKLMGLVPADGTVVIVISSTLSSPLPKLDTLTEIVKVLPVVNMTKPGVGE